MAALATAFDEVWRDECVQTTVSIYSVPMKFCIYHTWPPNCFWIHARQDPGQVEKNDMDTPVASSHEVN